MTLRTCMPTHVHTHPVLQKLHRLAATSGPRLRVRAALPQPVLVHSRTWAGAEAVLLIVGGIGITAVQETLHDMFSCPTTRPKRVVLLWSVRHASEFCVLPPAVAAAAL